MADLDKLMDALGALQQSIHLAQEQMDALHLVNGALLEAVVFYAEGRYDGGETARRVLEVVSRASA
jgi:hypothetical protein